MAVPARAIAERRVAEHFLREDAVRPDGAIDYAPERLVRARAFERLKDLGVLREGQGGRYYLDAPAWIERRDERRKRIAVIAAVAVAVGAVASIL
ncbi:hypothetical protein [Tsuneonella rigui]|uniref:hypothetical protein n=1 Tax=Tsuneonella rigui TaxID=1708790 RepID=UPI000F7ECD3C|nr:hypothetical protein [Tsuneonella rigui]